VGEVESAPGDRERIVPAAGQAVRLAEVGQEQRMVVGARRGRVGDRFL
jgi:hypothetical protein